jgi:hypothetical protein
LRTNDRKSCLLLSPGILFLADFRQAKRFFNGENMDYSARTDYWLQTALQRLTADGFTILNQNYFKVVARKSGFELSKFGNVDTFSSLRISIIWMSI